MNELFTTYKRSIEIGFLILILLGMDYLKIDDAEVRYSVLAIIGSLVGLTGLSKLPNKGP